MMKFLRKHMRKLLMVSMAFLLVAWLGGSALTTLMKPDLQAITEFESRFGEIRRGDRSHAEFSTTVLASMGIPWDLSSQLLRGQAEPLTLYDWVLLTREAQEAGFEVSPEEAQERLTAMGVPPGQVARIARRWRVAPDRVYEAFAEYHSVMKARDRVGSAARVSVSEAEIRKVARDCFEQVKIGNVVLKASGFSDDEAEFADAELQELFEKHREDEPGRGLSFGYFLPPRVKVQYIKVTYDNILQNVRVPDQTLERRAKDFWKANRSNPIFRRPPEETETDQDDEGPTTQPAEEEKPKSPFFETFTEAREAALTQARRDAALEAAGKVADELARQLDERWYDAERDDDGYKKLPSGVEDLGHYEAMMGKLSPELVYEGAVTTATTDWFTPDEARQVADIGAAMMSVAGGQRRAFTQLAFLVQGLAEIPTGRTQDTSVYLARFQTCTLPLEDTENNLYLYRVIDVEPARAPETLADVRDQVVEDLRQQRGFELAQQRAEALLAAAKESTLKDAWDAAEGLATIADQGGASFTEEAQFARDSLQSYLGYALPTYVPGVGFADDEFVNACFALDETNRYSVIPQPDTANVVIVEWKGIEPLREDTYQEKHPQVSSTLAQARVMDALMQWVNPEMIRSRNQFEPVKREQ